MQLSKRLAREREVGADEKARVGTDVHLTEPPSRVLEGPPSCLAVLWRLDLVNNQNGLLVNSAAEEVGHLLRVEHGREVVGTDHEDGQARIRKLVSQDALDGTPDQGVAGCVGVRPDRAGGELPTARAVDEDARQAQVGGHFDLRTPVRDRLLAREAGEAPAQARVVFALGKGTPDVVVGLVKTLPNAQNVVPGPLDVQEDLDRVARDADSLCRPRLGQHVPKASAPETQLVGGVPSLGQDVHRQDRVGLGP
mmetsp:Transcript_92877/g.271877  ORF Transcript_92877/g.271877 Transcript_92877/m.271877 type:complete len:252 (-) Transcript_92877:578-1333(-)